jgi:hypothetical protein
MLPILFLLFILLLVFIKHRRSNFGENNNICVLNNLEVLKVYTFDKKIRYGSKGDGGYVLADLDGGYDCYISAGVSDEESFSRDFINRYNMNKNNSYAFDGTISDYPWSFTSNITFIKKNINNINDDKNTDLSFLTGTHKNIFLKMDIEGGEYPWILHENNLNNFKQIVLEFHGITNDSWNNTTNVKASCSDILKCLEKLNKTHYIVHVHGNNFSPVVNSIPDVIELTYVNKKYFNSVPVYNTQRLPDKQLDFPNNVGKPDVDLNVYPFVN